MRRISALVIACAMILSLAGCGGGASSAGASSASVAASSSSAASSEADDISKDEGLFNVTIVYPADYVSGATQEQLDQEVTESDGGIQSATLNEDGTATYVMTKAYHDKLLRDMADNINSELNAMVGSEDYPNITAVEATDDFTSFTITTTSTELSMDEAFSVLSLYFYGGMYGIVAGEQPENIHVDFVNADTGEIIESADSSDAGSEG